MDSDSEHQVLRTPLALLSIFIWLALAMLLSCSPAVAQIIDFVKTDIGSPGASGSYSYSAGTYTVAGAGGGITGSADSFTFASAVVSGPGPGPAAFGPGVEMVAKVTSQTGTGLSPSAQAGIMFRDSLNANGASACLTTSPSGGNGINLTVRPTAGQPSNITLGPSLSAPIFLRLVLSKNEVAGYQSVDGIRWVLVGRSPFTLPKLMQAGFAVSSNTSGTLSTATFTNAGLYTNVPQRDPNMLCWLRADNNVQYASGTQTVSTWSDSSQYSNGATATGTTQPVLVTNAVNGLPAVNFASSKWMKLPTAFGQFSEGLHIFAVVKPSTGARTLFDVSAGAAPDSFSFSQTTTTNFRLTVTDDAGTPTNVDGTQSNSVYQLLEAAHNNAQQATLYKNGVQAGINTEMNNIAAVSRTQIYLGRDFGSTQFFNGQVAELIVYRTQQSDATAKSIRSYLHQKYGFGSTGIAAPTITPGNLVSANAVSLNMSAEPGTVIHWTDNGSVPTSASPVWTDSQLITTSTVIKAVAIAPGLGTSAVSTSTIEIDPNAAVVFQDGLLFWLRSTNGIELNGTTVSKWYDCSGNGHVFEQATATKQPNFLSNQVNTLPAVEFVGGSNNPHLKCTSNFNQWAGSTIFIVLNPTSSSPSGSPRMLDIGNGTTAQDNLGMNQPAASDYRYFAYDGTTVKNCTHTGGLTVGSFQLLGATEDTTSLVARVFKNGLLGATTSSFSPLQDVTRASTVIGANSAGTGSFQGKFAEVIVFNSTLSDTQRDAIQRYLLARYRLLVAAPLITPGTGMYSVAPQPVTLTVDPGATASYTLDGSDPATSGTATQYTGTFALASSKQVRAVNKQLSWSPPQTSTISEAFIGVDALTNMVPTSGLKTWLRSDIGVLTSSGSPAPVDSWIDMSNTGHTATAAAPNRPTLATNAYLSLPAVNFSQSPTAQLMTLGGTYNLTQGLSAFLVANVNTPVTGGNMLNLTQTNRTVSAAANSSNNFVFTVTTGATSNNITGAISNPGYGSPLLLEVVQDAAATASSWKNGTALASGSVINTTGTALAAQLGNSLSGRLLEVLLYDRNVTDGERADIENYLKQRYQLSSLATPVFSYPHNTTFAAPTYVAVSAPPNTTLHFTVDGSPATASSPVYSSPILVAWGQTINVIAVSNINSTHSVSASATYAMQDPLRYPVPSLGGTTAPVINLQLPTTAQ